MTAVIEGQRPDCPGRGPARGAELTRAHLERPGMIVYLAQVGGRCVAAGVLGFDDAGAGHLGVLVEDLFLLPRLRRVGPVSLSTSTGAHPVDIRLDPTTLFPQT